MAKNYEENKDIFDLMVKQIEEKRDEIIAGLEKEVEKKEYTEFTFEPFNGDDYKIGDCRHHSGIDVKINEVTKYFIGFTGLNMDRRKGNIHSSIGRVQLFVGDGNPNVRHTVDGENWYEINYPGSQDERLDEVKEYNRTVYNTGYRLFGNLKSKDELLNSASIEKFCESIIEHIRKMELGEKPTVKE